MKYKLNPVIFIFISLVGYTSGQTAQCFQEYVNQNAGGAEMVQGVTTLDRCSEGCLATAQNDLLTCYAFDFDTRGASAASGQCWMHFSPPNGRGNLIGVAHYVRDFTCSGQPPSGGCTNQFQMQPNMNVQGAQEQNDITTLEQCRARCLGTLETAAIRCHGFDYDNRDSVTTRCWIHYVGFASTGSFDGVDNYRRQFGTCGGGGGGGGGCVNSFAMRSNTNAGSGVQAPGVTTADGCNVECLRTNQGDANFCFGYDFDTRNEGSCWLHRSSTSGRTGEVTGVNHYTRNIGSCDGGSTCVNTFTVMANRNAGGAQLAGQMSVDQCREACLNSNQGVCYAFDYDRRDRSCWIHRNRDPSTGPFDRIDHHLRNMGTCGGTGGGGDCINPFTRNANTNAHGAARQTDISTPEVCQLRCLETNQGDSDVCTGFDYNTVGNTCWIHTQGNPRLSTATGIDHYTRDFSSCDGGSLPQPPNSGCPANYCRNGGTCFMLNNQPVCNCPNTWTGPTCQQVPQAPGPGQQFQCNGNQGVSSRFNQVAGSMSLTSYSPNSNCQWVFTAPANQVPLFMFTRLGVDGTLGNCNDRLEFLDASQQVTYTGCGFGTTEQLKENFKITTGTQEMTIRLISDGNGIGTGFDGSWTFVNYNDVLCQGQLQLTPQAGTTGYISSNPGSLAHVNNMSCRWVITAPPSQGIRVYTVVVDIKQGDTVMVIRQSDGKTVQITGMNQFAEVGPGQTLTVEFATNGAGAGIGFLAEILPVVALPV